MEKERKAAYIAWIVMTLLLFTVPLYIKNLHWLGILTFANIFALFVISWDISSGHTGYLSLGHTFFIGLGGYTSAILTRHLGIPLYPSLCIAAVSSMIIGTLLIVPAFRIRGPYFLMLSLALPLFLTSLVRIGYFTGITGGHMGLFPLPVFAPVPERYKTYFLTISITVVFSFLVWKLSSSDVGFVFKAIYQDEELVGNLGLNTFKYKLLSFMISNFIAGLGGALWVHNIGSVAPHSILDLYIMVEIVIAVMIGGSGTIVGPLFGAYFCMILLEVIRPIAPGPWRLLVFTLIGGGIIAVKPSGFFIELLRRIREILVRRM